jgi:hypothetical protein
MFSPSTSNELFRKDRSTHPRCLNGELPQVLFPRTPRSIRSCQHNHTPESSNLKPHFPSLIPFFLLPSLNLIPKNFSPQTRHQLSRPNHHPSHSLRVHNLPDSTLPPYYRSYMDSRWHSRCPRVQAVLTVDVSVVVLRDIEHMA